ncbi:MAG: hypothetical protein UY76_C0014G0009, partial [Candidatus Uhrbacteria bacterium GW2011_GWA2_52_8d]
MHFNLVFVTLVKADWWLNMRFFNLSMLILFCSLFAFPIRAATTWTVQDDGTMQSVRGITGSGDVLVAVGNTGNRMRSTDAGVSWSLLANSGSVWWHDVDPAANGDFLAVGESGAYAYSDDD